MGSRLCAWFVACSLVLFSSSGDALSADRPATLRLWRTEQEESPLGLLPSWFEFYVYVNDEKVGVIAADEIKDFEFVPKSGTNTAYVLGRTTVGSKKSNEIRFSGRAGAAIGATLVRSLDRWILLNDSDNDSSKADERLLGIWESEAIPVSGFNAKMYESESFRIQILKTEDIEIRSHITHRIKYANNMTGKAISLADDKSRDGYSVHHMFQTGFKVSADKLVREEPPKRLAKMLRDEPYVTVFRIDKNDPDVMYFSWVDSKETKCRRVRAKADKSKGPNDRDARENRTRPVISKPKGDIDVPANYRDLERIGSCQNVKALLLAGSTNSDGHLR